MRKCKCCGVDRPESWFYKRKEGGYRAECKVCKQGKNKYANKKSQLKASYGLELLTYQEMIISQNGCCKICGDKKALVVDHCHTTNQVRGLLCNECNIGLGKFRDDPGVLSCAVEYLVKAAQSKEPNVPEAS